MVHATCCRIGQELSLPILMEFSPFKVSAFDEPLNCHFDSSSYFHSSPPAYVIATGGACGGDRQENRKTSCNCSQRDLLVQL